jgi:hypothetical protein
MDALVWAATKAMEGMFLPAGKIHTGVGRRVRVGAHAAVASRRLRAVS